MFMSLLDLTWLIEGALQFSLLQPFFKSIKASALLFNGRLHKVVQQTIGLEQLFGCGYGNISLFFTDTHNHTLPTMKFVFTMKN